MVDIEPSKDFAQQLQHLWWRLDRAIDLPILEASGLAGLRGRRGLRGHEPSSTTTRGPEAIDGSLSVLRNRPMRKVGLHGAFVCYETTDRNGMEGARAGVRENLRFAQEIDDAARPAAWTRRTAKEGSSDAAPRRRDDRRPRGLHPIGDETLAALGDAVKTSGRGSHIHAGEDKFDAVDSRYRFGKDLMAVRFDEAGLLGPKSIVGHGVWLTESEVELSHRRGTPSWPTTRAAT